MPGIIFENISTTQYNGEKGADADHFIKWISAEFDPLFIVCIKCCYGLRDQLSLRVCTITLMETLVFLHEQKDVILIIIYRADVGLRAFELATDEQAHIPARGL